MSSLNRTLKLLYIFYAVRSLWFFIPIWALFLYETLEIDIFLITVLDIAFWVTIAIAEIPTGTVADKVSRKLSITIGLVLSSFAIIVFASATNAWIIVIANIIWAVGITFWSGADEAFLYDTLKSYQKEKEYQRIQGRLLFFSGLTTAAASLIGGFLGMYDLRLPIFLTAGAVLASLGIFLFIPEERPENGLSTENYSTHVVETIHLIRKNPMIVLLFSFFIIFSILAIIEGVFRQIYLETELGIEVFVIGAIYAVMIILTSFGARFSYRLTDVLGPKLLLWVHVIIIGISFALLSLAIPWLSIPAILVFGLFLSTYLPFSSQIINDEIPSEKRATVFSMLGIGVTTTGLVFEVLAGYLAKSTSISFTYSILTILFLLLCVIPLIFWTKTSFQEKATLD